MIMPSRLILVHTLSSALMKQTNNKITLLHTAQEKDSNDVCTYRSNIEQIIIVRGHPYLTSLLLQGFTLKLTFSKGTSIYDVRF